MTRNRSAAITAGAAGVLLGWIAAGVGMVGQPHIMIRAMAIDSPDSVAKARRIYISWYIVFAGACIAVGVAARAAAVGRVLADGDISSAGAAGGRHQGILSAAAGPLHLLTDVNHELTGLEEAGGPLGIGILRHILDGL